MSPDRGCKPLSEISPDKMDVNLQVNDPRNATKEMSPVMGTCNPFHRDVNLEGATCNQKPGKLPLIFGQYITHTPLPSAVHSVAVDPTLGYFVGNLGGGVYWVTDGSYSNMFMVSTHGVIVVE
ncbi:hypothetical protein C8F04DRAFT_1174818 [Mycena alexandri]|uniref:Uncharacterized protein n=1 Tax=Mycena alexandri TaxID=1745969 RepID=A0AAD6THK2_9AGAR|nr:hypothetical protein C8F04DRAFT_1174818 [Mycena alexandri]